MRVCVSDVCPCACICFAWKNIEICKSLSVLSDGNLGLGMGQVFFEKDLGLNKKTQKINCI